MAVTAYKSAAMKFCYSDNPKFQFVLRALFAWPYLFFLCFFLSSCSTPSGFHCNKALLELSNVVARTNFGFWTVLKVVLFKNFTVVGLEREYPEYITFCFVVFLRKEVARDKGLYP